MSARAIVFWTLFYGVLWNALGWAGNNFILGADWDAAGVGLMPDFAPPWSGLTRELMSLVSDFVYAFGFVWLFSRMREQSVGASIALVFVVWLCGAAVTYLAIVNSGFLPWPITAKTSLLALVIFLATAPILPMAIKPR